VEALSSGLWKYLSGLKFRYPEMIVAATVLSTTDKNKITKFFFIAFLQLFYLKKSNFMPK
jgi:hypothetical protein